MKKDECFGIIPIWKEGQQLFFFLVHHRKGHISFPKGHAEKGEKPFDSAVRELFEESRLEVAKQLLKDSLEERYQFVGDEGETIDKTVTYFVCEVKSTAFQVDQDEVVDAFWLTLDEVIDKCTFANTIQLCRYVTKQLQSTAIS